MGGENLLFGSIPPSIGDLTKLSNIVLHDNELTGSIPSEIGNMESLTQIVWFNNKLTGIVPASLGRLSKLEALALFNNKLESWASDSVCPLFHSGVLAECSLAANPFVCPTASCASNCSATCSSIANLV